MEIYLLYFKMDYEDSKDFVGAFTSETKLLDYKNKLLNSNDTYLQYYKHGCWYEEIGKLNPTT